MWRDEPAELTRDADFDAFPWLITLLCLTASAWIWFRSTAPVVRERGFLQHHGQRLLTELEGERRGAEGLALRMFDLEHDLQALLVELDARGLHPADLSAEGPLGPRELADALRVLTDEPAFVTQTAR